MFRLTAISCGLMTVSALGGCSLVRGAPLDPVPQPRPATTSSLPSPSRTADSSSPDSIGSTPPVSRTYEVLGETYPVWSDADGYVERGIASWYGEELAGRPTASGEPFDPYAMTAAHRSLPLGTRVEVENLENGRTVIVLVNDRGPFVDDRIIDLALAAAQALGFAAQGTTRVEVRSLD